MSVIPASRLTTEDMRLLGNNVGRKAARRIRHHRHRMLAAVNRSLAGVGEQIQKLHRPLAVVA